MIYTSKWTSRPIKVLFNMEENKKKLKCYLRYKTIFCHKVALDM